METAANRQCDKDVATDVGDFSEAIKYYFRRQRPAGVMAYAAVGSDERNQVLPGVHGAEYEG